MSRSVYRIDVIREGRWWTIPVPEVDYTTQARHFDEVEDMARDLIAGDTEPDGFDVDVHIATPVDVGADLDRASELERVGQQAVTRAAHARREAARRLRREYGMSVIDIAAVLGISRGPVYQLLDEREQHRVTV